MVDDFKHTNLNSFIEREAKRLNFEPAVLWAIVETESAGQLFAEVDGKKEPLIRFEGHYFDARLKGEKRTLARKQGLANPKAGAVKNPKSQKERWELLKRAMLIDKQAALESVSWGCGQVMGTHWKVLGYKSVEDLVNECRSSTSGQVSLMLKFIQKNGLIDEMQRKDFPAFARVYNGPNYKKYQYDIKLLQNYKKYSGGKVPIARSTTMLRNGSSGAAVREIQSLLGRAGYTVKIDGDFGPSTTEAVKEFQKDNKIEPDGVVGPETRRKLDELKISSKEEPGRQPVLEVSGVKEGLSGGTAGAFGVEAARSTIESAAAKITGIPNLEWLSNGLTIISTALVVGGLIYAAYHWYKSRKTIEGDEEHEKSSLTFDELVSA